jgi:hypothetical protein
LPRHETGTLAACSVRTLLSGEPEAMAAVCEGSDAKIQTTQTAIFLNSILTRILSHRTIAHTIVPKQYRKFRRLI